MTPSKSSSEVTMLLHLIDEGYHKKAWHGPNLRGSIRGITARQALWRPGIGKHNIWEIAIHTAYWKYTVRKRLLGEQRRSFPLKGSNWFQRSGRLSEQNWRSDLMMLDEQHASMRKAIAALQPSELWKPLHGNAATNFTLVSGIAAHDVYHAGQIQLIKRLM